MHILIIGGGVIGLATAWQLAQKGCQVTIAEKNTCGSGASTVAPGALMPYNPSRTDDIPTLQRQSLNLYPNFVQKLEADSDMCVGYTQNGRLQPIQSSHHLTKIKQDVSIAHKEWPRISGNPAMEVLSPEASLKIEPNLPPTEFGTLHCRVSGHIHTKILIKALVKACKKHAVTILENTEITNLKTAQEQFKADKILVAAGAWSSNLIAPKAIYPLKGQVIVVQTKQPLLGKSFIRAKGLYIIQTSETEITIGATKEPDVAFDISPTDESTTKLYQKACQVVPALEGCPVITAYCGLRPASASGAPIMDNITDNIYLSSGHGGIGICMMPIASQIMSEKLLT